MADTVNAKILDSQGNAVSDSNSLPVHGTVAVSNLPGTQPVSGTVAVSNLPATQPVSAADGALTTVGTTTDASSTNTLVGLLKAVKSLLSGTLATSRTWTLGSGTDSVNVGNFPATQPISSADGSQATMGTTTDASSANTLVGLLKAIKAAITGTLTTNATIQGTPTVVANVGTGTQPVSGTVTANAGSGTLATSVADGSDVALGATTDASSANTVIGILKAIKAAITGTLATSRTWTLSNGTDSVNVGNFPATQPVSGAVTSNDGGSPITGQSLPTGSGVIGWLSRIYAALTGTLTTNATISGTPTVTSNVGTGTRAISVADGSDVAQGTTTDAASASTVIGLLKNIKAALAGTLTTSVSNFPATQPVSGTVTANAGTGTLATSVADGQNATIGTTTDASSVTTLVGLLKAIKAAVQGTLTVGGTVTANAGTGTLATSVADGSNVAIGTTTDASSASTLVGLLKAIKAAVQGTLTVSVSGTPTVSISGTPSVSVSGTPTVSDAAQTSLAATLCSNVTSTTPSTGQNTDGYNGAQMVELIAVGTVAGHAVSLQIEGSYDNTNWYIMGTYQVDANASLNRSAANFTLTPGNGTLRHVYQALDLYKFVRINPTANTLGTGLTAKLYAVGV